MTKPTNKFPIAYFLLAYFFTWSLQIPAALDSQKIISLGSAAQIFLLASIFGPFLAAFCLTYRENGSTGVRQLLRRGYDFRFDWRVYLFVAVVPLSITFLAFQAVGGAVINRDILYLPAMFVLYFFLGGSFGEEFGWRGYALPRLLKIFNPLTATAILGVLWAAWHLPLFWIFGTSQSATPIWLYFIYVTALAFQYTWVFRRAGGSVFAALLLHTFTNITIEIFPVNAVGGTDRRIYYETALASAVAVILIAANFRQMLSPPGDSAEKDAEKEKNPEENDHKNRQDHGEQAADVRP